MSDTAKSVVKVADPQNGVGWRFKNRLFEFGAVWLKDVDTKVARGDRPAAILDWLRNSYKGAIPLPDIKTVRSYVKWKKDHLRVGAGSAVRMRMETERTEQELQAMMMRLNIAEVDVGNKKDLLERMIRFLLVRTEVVSKLQDNLMDPRYERNINDHLALVKSVVDSLAKMEGQIGEHEYIARRIVEKFLSDLAPIIKQVAEEVYGADKIRAFMEKLAKGYGRVDWNRIKKEVRAEVEANQTQGVVDVIKAVGPVSG